MRGMLLAGEFPALELCLKSAFAVYRNASWLATLNVKSRGVSCIKPGKFEIGYGCCGHRSVP